MVRHSYCDINRCSDIGIKMATHECYISIPSIAMGTMYHHKLMYRSMPLGWAYVYEC